MSIFGEKMSCASSVILYLVSP